MRALLLTLLLACGGGTAASPTAGSASSDLDTDGLGKSHAAPTPPPTPDAAVAAGSASPSPPAPSSAGFSFKEEMTLLTKIAACGGPEAERIPESMGDALARDKLARVAQRHCANVLKRQAEFRTAYFEKHHAWFEQTIPKTIPKTVVYPFGGGDLLSALVAFPDATEITTISLELAGDPRRIKTLKPDALGNSLAALRVEIGGLLSVGSNTSVNLSAQQRNDIPGQVASHLMGLVTAGYEPTDMRYFRLDEAGTIVYAEQADIAVAEQKMKALKGDWASPTFSEVFAHVEIRYRKPGDATERVFRHLGWNLDDQHLTERPQLLKHLASKGKVTMLTKGASYLLHRPTFSKIRTYLLEHLAWMLSDSTGVPPLFADPAGMTQETYGTYAGAFLEGSRGTRADQSFVALWRKNPRNKLGFRFGYIDAAGAGHLVVTRPK